MAVPANLKHSPEVIFQEVSGEMVLLDLESEQYFGLDAVGARIWQLIGENGDFETLLATLLEEYDVDRTQLQVDCEKLIGELLTSGLLTAG